MIKYIVNCIEKAKDGVFIFTPENNPRMAMKLAGNGFKIGERYTLSILSSGAMEIEICPNSGDLNTKREEL